MDKFNRLKPIAKPIRAMMSGASISGRPQFQQMLDDIAMERDAIDAVLVFKLLRFGRNAADVTKSIQLLFDYDINLICVDDGIDSSTPTGRLTLSILSAIAEIEKDNISDQFYAGRIQKIKNGGWSGGTIPYGYHVENASLVVNKQEAEGIKLGLTKMYNSEVFDDYTKIQELFEKTKDLQDQTYYTQKIYKR